MAIYCALHFFPPRRAVITPHPAPSAPPTLLRITSISSSLCAYVPFVAQLDLSAPAIDNALIERINKAGLTWTAAPNARFANMTLAEAKILMGTKRDKKARAILQAKHSKWDGVEKSLSALPASFDVRTAFPWASNITSIVRDQSACGSCWAFGSTEAANDRLSIATNYSQMLAAADTMECVHKRGVGGPRVWLVGRNRLPTETLQLQRPLFM